MVKEGAMRFQEIDVVRGVNEKINIEETEGLDVWLIDVVKVGG